MMTPLLKKNDAKAKAFILTVSVIVFVAVAFLTQIKLDVKLPFDVHVFATSNAVINSMVAFLLIGGLAFVKQKISRHTVS